MNMSRILPLSFALGLLAPMASGQDAAREVKLTETASVSLPANWRLQNQDRDSISFYVPLQKERGARKGEAEQDEKEPDSVKPNVVIASEIGVSVTIEHRRDHAEAVRRVAEIAAEYPERAHTTLIAGWPAIERRRRGIMPQPGEAERPDDIIQTQFATVAVAVDATVYRFEAMLAPDADPKLLDQAIAIGRDLRVPVGPTERSRLELRDIERVAGSKRGVLAPPAPGTGGARTVPAKAGDKGAGVAVQVQTGVGELEVATPDGQHVIVAANSGFSFSDNGGSVWTIGGGTPCNQAFCDGDPSLAVGQSGAIYYSWIGGTSKTALSDGVSRNTPSGHTFTFRALAATCPGATGCTVADQEHIAADRNNASASSNDRVYNVWRDFGTAFTLRISCSSDGGATWTSGVAIGAGDFPRVSVGGDSFVYVAWASGGNMQLHKFSNCDSGLTPQVGWPITVSAFTNVACPVPGLDRCNGRNILSSPKVAVDDLDPTHIYYAFATSTGTGNENVLVFDSSDGGATFPRSVQVNSAVTARRFMPWISSYGGVATVGWYDRRNATAANNDLTRYFIGGAAVRGPNLVALTEIDLSGANDNECSTWPAATNATSDSESCSIQPELAGRCLTSMGAGSNTPCDFTSTVCPSGETCQTGRGAPKYGDYNGVAAGAGLRFSAWSSSVPPAGVGGTSGTIRVYASADRLPSDFYVRDWNAAPNFDNGAQPSTNPVFWATSDVWNQASNSPEAAGPDGSVLGDPADRTAPNFAFAQVSRRAAATPTAPNATVTVNFFLADYGLNTPFASIGSETVTFAAGDLTKITPAHSWNVPAGASSHLCLGVQIVGPDGDTFAPPSLSGALVSPSNGIRADNNKAQRNLQPTIGTSAGTEIMAMIGNAGRVRRPIKLRLRLSKDVKLDATVEVIGGKSDTLKNDLVVETPVLAPGANTWLRFHAASLADLKEPIRIDVFEDTNPPANGFSILLRNLPSEEAARRNLLELAGVFRRLSSIEQNPSSEKLAQEAIHVAAEADGSSYLKFQLGNASALDEIIGRHLRRVQDADVFKIGEALRTLRTAVAADNADAAIAAGVALVERLDADVTAGLRRHGVPTSFMAADVK
jgi:hypothetical protein